MKTFQIVKGYGYTDLQWSKDPRWNQHKEDNPKTHCNQTVKIQRILIAREWLEMATCKRIGIRLWVDINAESFMSGGGGMTYSKCCEKTKICIKITVSEKLLFRNKGERKIFPDNVQEFIPSRLALQEMLNEIQVEIMLSENIKIMKVINSLVKVNI